MSDALPLISAAYDEIATDYDLQWSVHVEAPQHRLTRELAIKPGERCADLGCGTGVDTVEMLRLAAPGEVVGVDCSPAMLEAARRRASAAGLSLETHCQGADEFISECPPESFDLISLRFCLGYLDWRSAVPRLPGLLRSGGRVGILAILATSAPQAQVTYREMTAELGLPELPITALSSVDLVEDALKRGGSVVESSWVHRVRLTFASGTKLASFLRTSGLATAPVMSTVPAPLMDEIWAHFARRVESQATSEGIPLDFDLGAVVCRRD